MPPPKLDTQSSLPKLSSFKFPSFDFQGKGFDTETALRAGLTPDNTGHFQSVLPIQPGLGLILKGRSHPSFLLTEQGERKLGNSIIEFGGRLYSVNLSRLNIGR